MALSYFTDRDHPPTMEQVRSVVGTSLPLWDALTGFVEESYGVQGAFKSYGKNYGWMLAFHKGGKTLISFYPRKDSFAVQLILGSTQVEDALGLTLGSRIERALAEAHQYPEGRWVYAEVESEQDVEDLQRLLLLKAKPATKNIAERRRGPRDAEPPGGRERDRGHVHNGLPKS